MASSLSRRRSTLTSVDGSLLNMGISGEAALEKQKEALKESMKDTRRRRTSVLRPDQQVFLTGNPGTVPNLAYTSACCSFHQVSACYSREEGVQELPAVCRDSPVCQGFFGNTNDLFVESRNKGHGGGPMQSGVNVGLPRLDSQGWTRVEESKVIKSMRGESMALEREYFSTALGLLDLEIVVRPHEGLGDTERMMATFSKNEIPGTIADVNNLIKQLGQVNHVNVVKFLQACEDEDNVYFIYEDCDGAGLIPMLSLAKREAFEPIDVAKLIQQLAAAVGQCIKLGLYHWDWSLWHVMSLSFQSMNPVKLFGVGLAGVMHLRKKGNAPRAEMAQKLRGSFLFTSPELAQWKLDGSSNPFEKLETAQKEPTDVFGLGCLVYQLITAHPPFPGTDETTVLRKICSEMAVFNAEFNHIEAQGVQVLASLLARDKESRPTMESLVEDRWIMRLSLQLARDGCGDDGFAAFRDPGSSVDRLTAFYSMCPAVRALGTQFLSCIREDRLAAIQEAFQLFDIKGNGTLSLEELSNVCSEKRDDIKQVFKAKKALDGSTMLSCDEFLQANVFANEILTERMLRDTFAYMDEDGRGTLSPEELLRVLKKVNPEVNAGHVVEFMGNADASFDMDLDFNEFHTFFPQVPCKRTTLLSNEKRVQTRHEITLKAWGQLKIDLENWLDDFGSTYQKFLRLMNMLKKNTLWYTEINLDRSSNTKYIHDLIKKLFALVQNMPKKVFLSKESQDVLRKNPFQKEAEKSQDKDGGAFALTNFLAALKNDDPEWEELEDVTELAENVPVKNKRKESVGAGNDSDAEEKKTKAKAKNQLQKARMLKFFSTWKERSQALLDTKDSKRRGVENRDILNHVVPTLAYISVYVRHHIVEQDDMLEAAEIRENRVPNMPFCVKCVSHVKQFLGDDEATIEIREYQRKREEELKALEAMEANPKNRRVSLRRASTTSPVAMRRASQVSPENDVQDVFETLDNQKAEDAPKILDHDLAAKNAPVSNSTLLGA